MKANPSNIAPIRIFPKIITRICGDSVEKLSLLNTLRVNHRIKQYKVLTQKTECLKNEVLEEIFGFIKNIENPKHQQLLQNIRRDIFNNRVVREKDLVFSKQTLSKKIYQKLSKLQKNIVRLAQHTEATKYLYNTQSKEAREHFKKLIAQNIFETGLTTSSINLFDSLHPYIQKPIEEFKKNDYQVENGLIRYYSRMATKTSPYSTFTSISISNLVPSLAEKVSVNGSPLLENHVRINCKLLRFIEDIFHNDPTLREYLYVSWNHTTSRTSKGYKYLRNQPNHVSFCQIPDNFVIEYIDEILSENNRITYHDLINEIHTKTTFPHQNIKHFTDKLIELGLIYHNCGISAKDNHWVYDLLQFLENTPQQKATLIKDFLAKIVFLCKKFSIKNSTDRRLILTQTSELLQKFCEELNVDKPDIKVEQIYFEDTTIKDVNIQLNEQEINSISLISSRFLGHVRACQIPENILEKLFLSDNSLSTKVGLLEFFEKYLLWQKNSDSTTPHKTKKEVVGAWKLLVGKQKNKVNVSIKQLEIIEKKYKIIAKQESISESSFMQLYPDKKFGLVAVVNGFLAGYGRFFSRFLNYFPEEITHSIRQWNSTIAIKENAINAENTNYSFHNANIHPDLLGYELKIPNTHQISDSSKINIEDLVIIYDESEKKLKLIDAKYEKQVFVFDMGFEAYNSALFDFLNLFSPYQRANYGDFIRTINEAYQSKTGSDGVVCFPRICIENKVVIQRQAWKIDTQKHQCLKSQQVDFDYYAGLYDWLKKLELPDEFFLSILNGSFDDKKPQYINLKNPILVDLFIRSMKKASSEIVITEALPSSKNHLKINEKQYVTEFVAQWYSK